MVKLSDYKAMSGMFDGETIYERPVHISEISNLQNKSGKVQVMLKVKDGFETNNVAIFDTEVSILQNQYPFFKEGEVVALNLTRKGQYYNADTNIKEVTEEVDFSDVAEFAANNIEAYYDYILKMVREASEKQEQNGYTPLSQLVINVYESYKDELMKTSSATGIHHTGIGGNLVHTAEVINICDKLLESCLGKAINREILICAAALHDVGKIYSYETDKLGDAKMSLNGFAFGGHHWDSMRLVNEETQKGNYNPEKIMIVMNAIASHHGSREFGDLATPIALESMWLNFADDLSAKHYVARKAIMELEPGEITPKSVYPLETKLYRREDQ